MAGKRPQLNFDIEESLKRAFIGKVKASGLDVKEVLTAYINSYLSEASHIKGLSSGTVIPTKAGSTKSTIEIDRLGSTDLSIFRASENRLLLRLLAEILESGVEDARKAVTENLKLFSRYVKMHPPESGRSGRRKGNPPK